MGGSSERSSPCWSRRRARYYDEALSTNVELSYVSWILTANDVQKLGGPLLSRVQLVRISQPAAAVAKGATPRALTAMMEQVFAIELKRRWAS